MTFPEGSSGYIREHFPDIWAQLVSEILPLIEETIYDLTQKDHTFPNAVANDLICASRRPKARYRQQSEFFVKEIEQFLPEEQRIASLVIFADFCVWAVNGEEGFYWLKH
ncbi:MAG TPA: hypothetical protein VF209_02775 [Patescibacteria group bacterium]